MSVFPCSLDVSFGGNCERSMIIACWRFVKCRSAKNILPPQISNVQFKDKVPSPIKDPKWLMKLYKEI